LELLIVSQRYVTINNDKQKVTGKKQEIVMETVRLNQLGYQIDVPNWEGINPYRAAQYLNPEVRVFIPDPFYKGYEEVLTFVFLTSKEWEGQKIRYKCPFFTDVKVQDGSLTGAKILVRLLEKWNKVRLQFEDIGKVVEGLAKVGATQIAYDPRWSEYVPSHTIVMGDVQWSFRENSGKDAGLFSWVFPSSWDADAVRNYGPEHILASGKEHRLRHLRFYLLRWQASPDRMVVQVDNDLENLRIRSTPWSKNPWSNPEGVEVAS
jgi:hypothetical protein